ncbi:PIM1 peptidase S16 family [Echinococcus multilocularis]|uniref:PIM1 peptidase S16 family n=1 Tax=Echinococcus multilocularis TaxID=6211 RepID=A0A087VWS4_ECHMU|nr:PIM1 peptidase S16 family [Echinococcus multilocularis]
MLAALGQSASSLPTPPYSTSTISFSRRLLTPGVSSLPTLSNCNVVFSSQTGTHAIDVVNSFAELYRVGTFVQIPERDDVGTKIGMPVMGHHMWV